MPKYLYHGSYSVEGLRGLLREGGSARREHFTSNVENVGGKVEAYYYAFGGDDVFAIVDLPDSANAAALSLAISAGGGFRGNMIVLVTPEEFDQAVRRAESVQHRPAGQQR
jgi:uncharacterized protein with GYD domain